MENSEENMGVDTGAKGLKEYNLKTDYERKLYKKIIFTYSNWVSGYKISTWFDWLQYILFNTESKGLGFSLQYRSNVSRQSILSLDPRLDSRNSSLDPRLDSRNSILARIVYRESSMVILFRYLYIRENRYSWSR